MPAQIRFKRGTLAQLNAAATANQLVQGEPYFITDTNEIAIGLTASTYQIYSKTGHAHSAADITSGTLATARGGTNQTSWTANRLAYANSTSQLSSLAAITANRALISNASGLPTHSAVTNTELGYVSGVTSAIQTQLNGKSKLFTFTTGSSLTIDGATHNFHTLSVSVNSSFSLSNLTTGLLYEFLVKNTGASKITITIPNTSDVRVADTVDISAGKAREFSLLWDGTKRYWQISEELIGA